MTQRLVRPTYEGEISGLKRRVDALERKLRRKPPPPVAPGACCGASGAWTVTMSATNTGGVFPSESADEHWSVTSGDVGPILAFVDGSIEVATPGVYLVTIEVPGLPDGAVAYVTTDYPGTKVGGGSSRPGGAALTGTGTAGSASGQVALTPGVPLRVTIVTVDPGGFVPPSVEVWVSLLVPADVTPGTGVAS